MQMEPILPSLDQTQRWQDEVQRLVRHQLSTCPFSVAAVENANARTQLTIVIAEVFDVDRDDLALLFHGHNGATIVRAEVTHNVEAANPLITLRHG